MLIGKAIPCFFERSEIFEKKKKNFFVRNFRNTAVESDKWQICEKTNLA